MNDKKNIDRLFQEKLKDFEATPSASVWVNISNKIASDKKQRKVIPLWLKITSIAASLLLLISLGNLMFINDDKSDVPNVVNTESEKTNIQETDKINTSNEVDSLNTIELANEGLNDENTSKNSVINKKPKGLNSPFENNNTPVIATNAEAINTKNDSNSIIENISEKGKLVAEVNNNNTSTEVSQSEIQSEIKNLNETKELNTSINNTDIANIDNKKDATSEEVTNAETNITNSDLTIEEALTVLNDIETLENSNQEEDIDRWRVAPNIAPVYFNTLGTGSSIHGQFNSNTKTGDVNMSYGISASYAINTRLSVRAGINKVNLGYSTNDVVVYNNIQAAPNNQLLRNIDFNKAAEELSFISVSEFNFAQVPGVLTSHLNAAIDQKIGFLEIPLEFQYAISNKTFGVSVIGGVSAFFLSDNEVFSVQDGKSTLLGKATNINNMSYSANLGLGLDYKISKKVNLNLEPMFKYQLNTFTNTSGNFKPYFIGVYSGFSFKF